MKMRIISAAVCFGLLFACQGFCASVMDELGSAAGSGGSLQLSPADQAVLTKNDEILSNPSRCRPFEVLLAKLGFDRTNALISEENVRYQTLILDNKIPFEIALEHALSSFVNDGSQERSPYALVLEAIYEEAGIEPEFPVPYEVDEKTREIVKGYINRQASELKLLTISETADNDEDVKTNWIFYLRAPELSENGFWAVVDRTGEKPVYNYPASSDYFTFPTPKPDPGIQASTPTPVSQTLDAISRDAETPEMRIINAVTAGQQLYNDYGNQRTLVEYDGWPYEIPKYGYFEEPYKKYVDNKEKIDHLRIDMRALWRELKKLESKKTPEAAEEAEKILQEMEKKGAQYSELVKQSNASIREGLRLNAAGLATFPSVLHNIRLVKGSTRIPLYGDDGKKIQRKGRCLKWERHIIDWPWKPVWQCSEWEMIDVMAKVPDYYLEYGYDNNPPKYEQVLPERLRVMAAEPVPAHPEDFVKTSLKRDQYDMEVVVTCTYSKADKAWLISSARLRKGKAGSSDSLGGGVGVSAGGKVGVPLVAEGSMSVSVNINYNHSWSHFRFGQMVEFREMYGKPCFELGKYKTVRLN